MGCRLCPIKQMPWAIAHGLPTHKYMGFKFGASLEGLEEGLCPWEGLGREWRDAIAPGGSMALMF